MKIPWADPWLDDREKEELIQTYDSKWLSMGSRVKGFENKMSEYIGVKHAIAVSNGTDAIDIALKVLGIGYGDEVIVPAMTYIATVSAVLYQGAIPVFADIELETYNIDPASIEKCVTPKTKAIIYIDYGGNPSDIEGIKKVADKYGLFLIQDGAQSLGARYKGERLCKQGHICTTSFHTAKLITTIEGGMIFTQDDDFAKTAKIIRNQGEDPNQKYIHVLLGTNARMTEMNAAIGLIQLKKFDAILKKRKYIAEKYIKFLSDCKKIILPKVRKQADCSWFFFPILVENRDVVTKKLKQAGIDTRIAYPMPVYEQPFFQKYKRKDINYDCKNAKWMTERVINLPMYHLMTDEQIKYVVEKLLDVVR